MPITNEKEIIMPLISDTESYCARADALQVVVDLYRANATKNATKSFTDNDKLVGDLVQDARYIESYLKGDI